MLVWPAIIRCSSSAIAVAKAGSFTCASTRRRASPATLSSSSSAARQASSASASRNGWPSASSALTPRSGQNTAAGPVAAAALRPIRAPSSAISAGVVRMSVTVGLCSKNSRPRNAAGTVSGGPKLTMSSAPGAITCGSPAAPAAVSRPGPADSTPPTRSSASSVVVRSSTPLTRRSSASASSARPPAPVAWKTSTS